MKNTIRALIFVGTIGTCLFALLHTPALGQAVENRLSFQNDPFANDFGDGGMRGDEGAAMLGMGVICAFVGIVLLISLAINIFIIILLSGCLKVLPDQYREMEPGMVWLLLIPMFNLVWNFFVFMKISKSYQRYFEAHNRTEFGTCGEGIGLAFSICAACSAIPYLGICFSLPALVLLIIYLITVVGLKKHVVPDVGKSMQSPGW